MTLEKKDKVDISCPLLILIKQGENTEEWPIVSFIWKLVDTEWPIVSFDDSIVELEAREIYK